MQAGDQASPIIDERLAALTQLLRPPDTPRLRRPVRAVLAVSGGPDSLAMLALIGKAQQALAEEGFLFSVATVDHGLRPEAAGEAAQVAAIARDFGLDHATLRWHGWAGTGNLQAAAREARYALLVEEAGVRDASAVVTAHTLDDQVETFLMAKARGAGAAGLAGMRDSRDLAPGIVLLRPLLGVSKTDLGAVLTPLGIRAAQDPSNDDLRFARVRARRDAALLTPSERRDILGALETAGRLRAAEDQAFLDAIWSTPREVLGNCDRLGRLFRDHDHIRGLETKLATRLLARAVTAAGGAPYPPATIAATRLQRAVREGRDGFAATLNGCQIRIADGRVIFSREYGRSGPAPVCESARIVFDARFDVSVVGISHHTFLAPIVQCASRRTLQRTVRS